MSLGQCVHNPHKGWPFLVNDCAVALNKITYFNCFELVNSHFITTKNNLHYQQLTIVRPKVVHRAIKCIRDGQHQRMSEWGQNGNSQATKISLFLFRRDPRSSDGESLLVYAPSRRSWRHHDQYSLRMSVCPGSPWESKHQISDLPKWVLHLSNPDLFTPVFWNYVRDILYSVAGITISRSDGMLI